jgi:hypothetical protein
MIEMETLCDACNANFTGVYLSHFTTFRNQTVQFYTNFEMLFNAAVMNYSIPNFLKFLPIRQLVHWTIGYHSLPNLLLLPSETSQYN